jgi:hypothetical protein
MSHSPLDLRKSLAIVGFLCLASSTAYPGTITNPGFDTPTPNLAPPNFATSITGNNSSGASSAFDWTLENQSAPTTSTELLPSTDPSGGGFMIHMTSTGSHNDLFQTFDQTLQTTASVDIFVLSGTVGFALADTTFEIIRASTTSTEVGQWETLTLGPIGPVNDILLFTGPGGADFFADNVQLPAIASVPEPSSLTLGILGFIGVVGVAICHKSR